MIGRETKITALILGLVLANLLVCSPVFAQSDDDSGFETFGQNQSGQAEASKMQIGVTMPSMKVATQRYISAGVAAKYAEFLTIIAAKVNVRPATILQHGEVLSTVGSAASKRFEDCYVNATCLAEVFKRTKLNILIASKLTAKPLGSGVEFNAFLRVIEMPKGKVLEEVLVRDVDFKSLVKKSMIGLHKALVKAELIVKDPARHSPPPAARPVQPPPQQQQQKPQQAYQPPPKQQQAYQPSQPSEPAPAMTAAEKGYFDEKRGARIAMVTLMTVGVIAEGLGGAFGVLAQKAAEDGKVETTRGGLQDQDDKRKTYTWTANGLYGFGGACLLTSVILLTLDLTDVIKDDAASSNMAAGFMLSPDGGGLMSIEAKF